MALAGHLRLLMIAVMAVALLFSLGKYKLKPYYSTVRRLTNANWLAVTLLHRRSYESLPHLRFMRTERLLSEILQSWWFCWGEL
ncbi:hypothetical protein OIU79_009116 [Salix purpurea]|uniref:Uncharacterized protein n=1 Tax=Salix purpurea TaxID=77065 RepID=A0A9Q0TK01_SALPP|nr:hypothetical protein OIU79_009116 [Salix purpurea]